ncbi:hypothetical protein VARIO8X_90482 [Burkholderiales bacterium 8X]|nr:hypothetical protein VARIO8X_90482 [Burkholderiales bacterium 8X]
MLKWKVLAAVVFGAIGLVAALWINKGATERDVANTLEQCGTLPADRSAQDDYLNCAADVRNSMGR